MADPNINSFSVNPQSYGAGSFGDFYRDWYKNTDTSKYAISSNSDSGFLSHLFNSMGGSSKDAKDAYNQYKDFLDRLYEQDTLAMQRQYEYYMDSTRYQRLVEDLKKAGLNPWLALNGGSASAGSVSIGSQGGSSLKSRNQKDGNDETNKTLSTVSRFLTTAVSSALMVMLMMG